METLRYVDLEEARAARGVRMVGASRIPSPWTEAAKGLFHIKRIPVLSVRFRRGDPEQLAWTGVRNAPAVMFDDEPPRTGWAEILSLAERLGGAASLVPHEERVRVFGLAHELAGEDGLGWNARLLMVHGSLTTEGKRSFPLPVAQLLAAQYGYTPTCYDAARARIGAILTLFDDLRASSQAAGHGYLLGPQLTALDVYLATFLTPLVGVTPEECVGMVEPVRSALSYLGEQVTELIPPRLADHRRKIYAEHLPWPIVL